MKDHDWSWTLLGAALVSLESLDMIFEWKNIANIADFLLCSIWTPRLIRDSEMPAWLGLTLFVKWGAESALLISVFFALNT